MAWRFLMLCAACPLLARARDVADVDDRMALLQTSAQRQLSTGGPCECRNWAMSYWFGTVKCGAGLEMTDEELSQHPDIEICASYPFWSFFKFFNHSYCVNAQKVKSPKAKTYPGTWCYVDASCNELNGGKTVNSNVSYKMCRSGVGETLAELPPKDLFALSAADEAKGVHMDGQMIALMAYDWFGPKENNGSLLEVQYDASKTPLIGASRKIDTFTVVHKDEVWEVHDGPGGECIKGCS